MSNSLATDPQASAAAPTTPLRDLSALELMLASGWRIEAPILARLSWAQRRTGELAYHVILTRASQRSLIVIAESPDLRQFFDEQDILIT